MRDRGDRHRPRRERPEDAETIVEFQVQMAKETEGLELDRAVVQLGVSAVFENPTRGRYWVAAESGRILGCLLTLPEWSDWRNGNVMWIHSVFVIPDARGRGVFRAMYRHLEQMVRDSDELRGLRLYVDKRNQRACRAYEAMGMDGDHYHLYEWLL